MFHHPEPKTCSLGPRSAALFRLQEYLIPLTALPPLLKYDEVITWPTCRRLIFLRWCKYIKYLYKWGRKNKPLSLFPTPSPALSLSLSLVFNGRSRPSGTHHHGVYRNLCECGPDHRGSAGCRKVVFSDLMFTNLDHDRHYVWKCRGKPSKIHNIQ